MIALFIVLLLVVPTYAMNTRVKKMKNIGHEYSYSGFEETFDEIFESSIMVEDVAGIIGENTMMPNSKYESRINQITNDEINDVAPKVNLNILVRPQIRTEIRDWSGTVYIRSDGSVEPSDAPIATSDNITYTLTDNITSSGDGIVVERDNIIIDGAGHIVQGGGASNSFGIVIVGRKNVTIRNIDVRNFDCGI